MKFRRAEHVAWRQIGDEIVVVDLEAKEMFGLNPPAGRLWGSLDRGHIDLGDCCADYRSFFEQLAELNLVQSVDDPSAAAPSLDPVAATPAAGPRFFLEAGEKPAIAWREPVEQAAATCAFLPGQNILCNSAPFS